MNHVSTLSPSLTGPRIRPTEIDASCRGPVLIFFASAIFWLLVGTLFGFLASFKMHSPWFLDASPWLTFGRIRPCHLNAMVYGWAAPAAIGSGIWMMARLCQVPLRHHALLVAAIALWNIGVVIGLLSILAGNSTSIEWLEFPTYTAFLLFTAYAFIGVWTILMFCYRQPGHIYVSQLYLFGAFFWFPWLYGVANIMLLLQPVQGSVQAIVNWWFGHNVLGLWFTPIGLAAIYYVIPKVIGKPVHSYYLSILGFWSLALFYSWNGMHHLIGGPVPSWLQSASIAASVMMVIPVATTAINHHLTMRGNFRALKYSPALRFVVFGGMSYTAVSLQGSSMAIRTLNQLTHFTHYTIGHAHFGMYAFFTMTMFGAIYYIVPRLLGREWPSARLIRIHFWSVSIGILLMLAALLIGGLVQGIRLKDTAVTFITIVQGTLPYLVLRSLSGGLLAIGHIAFATSFVLMLCRRKVERVESIGEDSSRKEEFSS